MELHLLNKEQALPKNVVFVWAPPSHGNVGQIAIDAIVSKYRKQCPYVGCIESKLVMPISGYCDVTGSKLLCKPLELYKFDRGADSVFFIQQRAPCLRGQARQFCQELAALLYGPSIACDLLLVATGASTASMLDEAILGNRIFAMTSQQLSSGSESGVICLQSSTQIAATVAASINLALSRTPSPVNKLQLAAVDSVTMDAYAYDNMYAVDQDQHRGSTKVGTGACDAAVPVYPHGMLLARLMFEAVSSDQSAGDADDIKQQCHPQVMCVGRYCSEGAGNIVDGQVIADSIAQMLNLF